MKKLIAITAAMMMATAPAMAQVFLDDMDNSSNRGEMTQNVFGVMVLSQDVNYDQFTPIGSGALLLAGLAGVYLIGKRKKEE